MLLKFKNKHILALEKLIADSDNMGGIIEHIVLDPKEAHGLISEIVDLGKKYTADIRITEDGVDITRAKLLMGGLRLDNNEGIKDIVNKWYKTHYKVKYKDTPLKVVKPEGWLSSKDTPDVPKPKGPLADEPDVRVKAPEFPTTMEAPGHTWAPPPPPPARSVTGRELEVPNPPTMPPGRLLTEGGILGQCDKCGSSLKSKWIFFKHGGCIQPECENFWKKYRVDKY